MRAGNCNVAEKEGYLDMSRLYVKIEVHNMYFHSSSYIQYTFVTTYLLTRLSPKLL
jgi:hypothetical protein